MTQVPTPESQRIYAPGIFADQVALVTGGGSGIGLATARELVRLGAKVAICGRTQAKLDAALAELGENAFAMPCDIREPTQVEALVKETLARFGRLDIVVNSAAGNFLSPAANLSANGFRAVIDIDLCGTFNACRASFQHLAKQGGVIVSITATQADVPTPMQVHAGAAKAGIAKLTRDLALEWGRSGIRVVAVAPGPVENTEGMARLAPGGTEDALKKRVPLGRYASIEEIASSVLYLVSPAASLVTGHTLLVDGGWTAR